MEQNVGDEVWMKRALGLARKGEGLTRPNPPVGSLLLNRKGTCIAEAWHRQAGEPHAESQLLSQAGDGARGGTLYVTLEPCSTHGRTPPCTEAILQAGVKRVIVGCQDPNPKHGGKGLRILSRRGLEVTTGVCQTEAQALVEPFGCWIERGTPFVTLKLATSLDGRIADASRKSKWISGTHARAEVQALRRKADAILVGSGTLRKDNPSLLPRPQYGRKLYRVILSTNCELSPLSKVFTSGRPERTLVVTTKRAPTSKRLALAQTGAEVLTVSERQGQVSLKATLRILGKRGLLHVLCEGGGEVAASLVQQKLVDEVWLFLAPLWIGSERAISGLQGVGWSLAQAPRFRIHETRQVGDDLLVRARPT